MTPIRPESLLEDLNGPQREAVLHRGGPLLVVAGAGSGKTRVLTRRVAHLVATGDAAPWQLLAITFTNKAADEMRERVDRLVGEAAGRMWVSTFHAACARILRSHADRLGYSRSFTIYDEADSKRLVEHVMRDLDIDTKRIPPRGVRSRISSAKSDLIGPEAFQEAASDIFERRIGEVYAAYQRRLRAASAMDFDDLLVRTVDLFTTCPDVLYSYRHRFLHVLVDEYQDTNRAQNELVLMLGAEHRNVSVVGDTDQSIYQWRGADIRNILAFEEAFPDATVVRLEQNYRSTRTILDAANSVIENNTTRIPKSLWCDGDQGIPIRLYRADDEHDEAAFVAGEVQRLLVTEGLAPGDMAVFYRTNAQSRVLEEELVRAGVAYRVIGGTRFYDRREVRDVLAYLRVLVNPADEISLARIANVPRRGLGDASMDRLSSYALDRSIPLSEALRYGEEAGLTPKAAKAAASLHDLLGELRTMAEEGRPPDAVVEAVLERTGYAAELRAEGTVESEGRLENLAELKGMASGYEDLDSMLEDVALVSDADELDDSSGRVSLMTLHVAKGLEFPAVFIVGMEEGVFPHSRSLDDPARLEEERRLCYVGITRAERFLYLSHTWNHALWGRTTYSIPSRFISEIPARCLREVGGASEGRVFGARRADDFPELHPANEGAGSYAPLGRGAEDLPRVRPPRAGSPGVRPPKGRLPKMAEERFKR
jgi:DNA helicase-2/ATP-dependent DNA helicase PcrA